MALSLITQVVKGYLSHCLWSRIIYGKYEVTVWEMHYGKARSRQHRSRTLALRVGHHQTIHIANWARRHIIITYQWDLKKQKVGRYVTLAFHRQIFFLTARQIDVFGLHEIITNITRADFCNSLYLFQGLTQWLCDQHSSRRWLVNSKQWKHRGKYGCVEFILRKCSWLVTLQKCR